MRKMILEDHVASPSNSSRMDNWHQNKLEPIIMGRGRANGDWARSPPPNAHITYKIGIYGWRKRCLYLFILIMMVCIVINLALTIWILQVMDFSIDGMGKLRMTDSGVQVQGRAEFIKPLHATSIRSKSSDPLFIESSRNISLHSRDSSGNIKNTFYIGDGNVKSTCSKFQIQDGAGKTLLKADKQTVSIGAQSQLHIQGESGAKFDGSVQTPLVRAYSAQDLKLSSPTRRLEVSAAKGLRFLAPAGNISLNSISDISVQSKNAINLDSKTININNLKVIQPGSISLPFPGVYQLCVCDTGKLFLAPPSGECEADTTLCSP
ncbi:unnamed protein product [Owenia fusiformis]|uniref:Delta-sarcoglycan n=1 Tax=Owenia fusiformis TaxID=6347 RepID=A0A8S4N7P7_OWEFU|nr:unnamed protein product [Owenia fusiformis]